MTNEELAKERDYFVAKANELITKGRYSLTIRQHKILLCFISKIQPNDKPGTRYTLSARDIIKLCGYPEHDGSYYKEIDDDIQKIADNSVYIYPAKDKKSLFRWFDTVDIVTEKKKTTYTITFHSTISPYLFDLRERYTLIRLYYLLCLSHKYSLRLYEYLCTMQYRGKFEAKVEDLKRIMDAEHYEKISHFKTRALEPAIDDINTYTELNVEHEYKRTGHTVSHVVFRFIEENWESFSLAERMRQAKINPETRRANRERKKEMEERRKDREKDQPIQGEGTVTAQLTIDEIMNELEGSRGK